MFLVTFVRLAFMVLLTTGPWFDDPSDESYFSDLQGVPNWRQTGELRTFSAENLWEYVNGDNERYLDAGVKRAITSDFKYRNSLECVVDLYIMSNEDGAKQILSSESSTNRTVLEMGQAGFLFRGGLVFRQGRFFVRLTAYEETSDSAAALLELGRAIEKKLASDVL